VYRAHDTKLGRSVALKVLPDAVAADPDRLARFEREAKALASLNHANIAAIYAVESSGSTNALVMECVQALDQLDPTPVPGAELEGRSPFFSPDGRWIGYYSAGELRRAPVGSGAAIPIAKAVNPWGATWAAGGRGFLRPRQYCPGLAAHECARDPR